MTGCVMRQKEINPEKQLAREVGGIIAIRRKAKGLTQAQLAEYMDIEKESVSRIETGHIAPTLARLAQIAKLPVLCSSRTRLTSPKRLKSPIITALGIFHGTDTRSISAGNKTS